MSNPENNFSTFGNNAEQSTNPEQTNQLSLGTIKEVGSAALNGYGANEIFEPQAPGVLGIQEIQKTQEIQATSETALDSSEAETAHANLVRDIFNKAKNSRVVRAALASIGLAAIMASSLAACGANKDTSQVVDRSASESVEQVESTTLSGEQSNGIEYDYTHYADREGKESANAYDYDMSDCYGDEEAFKTGIMEVAKRTPEALASYTYTIFTDEEKRELGIDKDMSMVAIDNAMSNSENGGILQKRLLNKMESILQDKESTRFNFYRENDYETSSYTYFVDANNDGTMVPTEMHLGQAYVKRSGAPQVDVERKVTTASGSTVWVKAADINLRCGGQINGRPEDFPDVPVIDPNDPTPTPENPTTAPDPTQPPEETIEPKDRDNLRRIDEQIQKDSAKDIGSYEVHVETSPPVSENDITYKTSSDTYGYTAPNIVQNEDAKDAETYYFESPDNNYEEDRGGAHEDEYAPVQADQSGQDAADAARIPNEELPDSGSPESNDILSELGIN